MLEPSSRSQAGLVYHFSPEAFGALRRLLAGQCGGTLETGVVDSLGDAATATFRVRGARLTLEYDHWDGFVSLRADAQGRGVLQSLRARLDASEYPVLEESDE